MLRRWLLQSTAATGGLSLFSIRVAYADTLEDAKTAAH